MPRDYPRTRRIGDQIQRDLAQLIRDEVRDPRVGLVTVSGVDVTRDLAHAKVYVSALGADADQAREMVSALNHAAGYLRKLLAHRLTIRTIPALKFVYDESFDRGARLSHLIDTAVAGEKRDIEGG